MASGYFRGEGGAVFEIDLPLSPADEQKVAKGHLTRVDADGSPYTEPAMESATPKKPNKASSKADWVAWAVHQGETPEAAEAATREALIERYHGAESTEETA